MNYAGRDGVELDSPGGVQTQPRVPCAAQNTDLSSKLPEETQPHKPAHTILWAGRARRGRHREKDELQLQVLRAHCSHTNSHADKWKTK